MTMMNALITIDMNFIDAISETDKTIIRNQFYELLFDGGFIKSEVTETTFFCKKNVDLSFTVNDFRLHILAILLAAKLRIIKDFGDVFGINTSFLVSTLEVSEI